MSDAACESASYQQGWRDAMAFTAQQAGMSLSKNPQRTSTKAASTLMPQSGSKLLSIYELICSSHEGLTDFEIEEQTGMVHQSASSARNVLMNRGLIKDAGHTRKNARGLDAIVWVQACPASKDTDDREPASSSSPDTGSLW